MLQERVRFEADALREQARLCPEHVPELFHFDAQLCLLVMQYLPPPHDVARRALTAGRIYPKLAQHMATFMARTLFGTSLFALDAKTWRCVAPSRTTTCSQVWCSCALFIQPSHISSWPELAGPDCKCALMSSTEQIRRAHSLQSRLQQILRLICGGEAHGCCMMNAGLSWPASRTARSASSQSKSSSLILTTQPRSTGTRLRSWTL